MGRLTEVRARSKLGIGCVRHGWRGPLGEGTSPTLPFMTDDVLLRRVRPSAEVVSSRLGDAGVLVHLQTNRIFELNSTGLRIWELLGEGRRLDDIERILQHEFDGDHERLRSDMLNLIGALAREGLVSDDDGQ